ncbi:MAG: sigma-70 family RNA polymerase sigma factor [Candidatus Hinthialibacter antarcticus]|nr:sigma-70 family RNA polymerase sigma factor [Candidatus Hinthialibacter antarcticus]
MPEKTEATLIEQVLKGKRECFRPLVESYQKKVFLLANGMLGHGPEAQDIAQEAFLLAFQKLREIEDPNKFGPWLFGITRNLCYNSIRSRKIQSEPFDESLPQHSPNVVALKPKTSDGGELGQDILKRLERLPEKYRTPLRLKYMEDYSYLEIAELLDWPVDLVRSRLFEGRRILRERMEQARREEYGR